MGENKVGPFIAQQCSLHYKKAVLSQGNARCRSCSLRFKAADIKSSQAPKTKHQSHRQNGAKQNLT